MATMRSDTTSPPKASRFGVRQQPDRSKRQSSKKEPVDLAALLDSPVRVARNGRQIKMHPFEATLYASAKQALAGQIRPLRHILKAFKGAGLLEAPPSPKKSGALVVPKGVPMELAARLVRMAGVPPWDADLFDAVKAEHDADCAHIQRLLKEAKKRQNEKES